MSNDFFIHRCEVVLATMKASNCQSVTTKQISKWIEATSQAAASQFVAKAHKHHIFLKEGARRNAIYKLSKQCDNTLSLALERNNHNVSKAVSYTVNQLVNHQVSLSASPKKPLTMLETIDSLRAQIAAQDKEIERLKQYEKFCKGLSESIKWCISQ